MHVLPIRALSVLLIAVAALLIGTGPPAPAQDEDDPPRPATEAQALQLEAIGGLSAVNAQHTYLLIGVVSDAHVKGVYQPRQVRTMMNNVVKQLAALRNLLKKLREGELSDEDAEFVEAIDEVYSLLQKEARALNAFVADNGDAQAEAFEKSRQAALKALDTLLGVEADEVEVKAPTSPARDADDEERTDEKK